MQALDVECSQTRQQPAVEVMLIIPFINSVRTVFNAMVELYTSINRLQLKSESTPAAYEISSIVGFNWDVIRNVISSFELRAPPKLSSAFADRDIDSSPPDCVDAVGELANMIAGGAKKNLGAAASITVPSVVIGKGRHIARHNELPGSVIPCHTPVGNFAVEANIKTIVSPQQRVEDYR